MRNNLIYLRDSKKEIFINRYEEIDAKEFLNADIGKHLGPNRIGQGYIGLVPYGSFNRIADLHESGLRIFSIKDKKTGTYSRSKPNTFSRIQLRNFESREAYLNKARQCLQDILNGRYYQINLLQYFAIDQIVENDEWIERLNLFGGDYSALISLSDLQVVSFSPESFFSISHQSDQFLIQTRPIKGTAPRFEDSQDDLNSAKSLSESPKDRAELNMIIDLMRNDLSQICVPLTTQVTDMGSLLRCSNVHHLQGEVQGVLKAEITFGEIFNKLCPGGSITGAPKLEVMKAISEYELRPREYFMGNIFYIDECGRFESSILIRTVLKNRKNPYVFAVGSGIVVNSKPEAEYDEIMAKARVIGELDVV